MECVDSRAEEKASVLQPERSESKADNGAFGAWGARAELFFYSQYSGELSGLSCGGRGMI